MLFHGTTVFNRTPRHMYNGGIVKPHKNMSTKQKRTDSLMVMLSPNELVIPRRDKYGHNLATLVRRNLMRQGIMLPGFRKK